MGVRVAYGAKDKISSAISSGVIPADSLIITSDAEEAELYFYDANGLVKAISERQRFETMSAARSWVQTYDCVGRILSVHNGSEWTPYMVLGDNTLSPIHGESSIVTDVSVLDGGSAGDFK